MPTTRCSFLPRPRLLCRLTRDFGCWQELKRRRAFGILNEANPGELAVGCFRRDSRSGRKSFKPHNTVLARSDNFAGQSNNGAGSRYSNTNPTTTSGSISPPPRTVQTDTNAPGIKAPWPNDERFKSSPLAQEYNNRNVRNENATNSGTTIQQSNSTVKVESL